MNFNIKSCILQVNHIFIIIIFYEYITSLEYDMYHNLYGHLVYAQVQCLGKKSNILKVVVIYSLDILFSYYLCLIFKHP